MAFIASKYEGGIMVNDINRLAPIFSGGEKLKYEPLEGKTVNALQTKAQDWNASYSQLLSTQSQLKAKMESGNFTQQDIQLYAQIDEKLKNLESMENQLSSEVTSFTKATEKEIGKKVNGYPIAWNSGTEYIAAQIGVITNPQEIEAITAFTNNDYENIIANRAPLYNENGLINAYSPSLVYTAKPKEETLTAFVNNIEATYSTSKTGNNADSAYSQNNSYYHLNTDIYTSNFVSLYSAYNSQKDMLVEDAGLFLQAKGEMKEIIYKSGLYKGEDGTWKINPTKINGAKTVSTSGLNNNTNVSFLTRNEDGEYYYEVYQQGNSFPSYYSTKIEQDENGINYYELGNSLQDAPEGLSYVKQYGISDEEANLLGLYLDLDGYGASVLGDIESRNAYIGNLYNAIADINIKEATNLFEGDNVPTLKENMTPQETEIYNNFETKLIGFTKNYGNKLLDALTTNYIYGDIEDKLTSKVKTTLDNRTNIKEFSDEIQKDIASAVSLKNIFENMQRKTYDINGQTLFNGKNSAMIGDGVTVEAKTVSPSVFKLFVDSEIYNTISNNNTKNSKNENQVFATVAGREYNINPDKQITLSSNYSNVNLTLSLPITGRSNPILIPFDASKAPGAIVLGFDNTLYLAAGQDQRMYKVDLPKGASINESFNAAKALHGGMTVSVKFADLAKQTIIVYKDEFEKMVHLDEVRLESKSFKKPSGMFGMTYNEYVKLSNRDVLRKELNNMQINALGRYTYNSLNSTSSIGTYLNSDEIRAKANDLSDRGFDRNSILEQLTDFILEDVKKTKEKYVDEYGYWAKDAEGEDYIVTTIGGLFPGKEGNALAKSIAHMLQKSKDIRFEKKDSKNGFNVSTVDKLVDMETSWAILPMMQELDITSGTILSTAKQRNVIAEGINKYSGTNNQNNTVTPQY